MAMNNKLWSLDAVKAREINDLFCLRNTKKFQTFDIRTCVMKTQIKHGSPRMGELQW